MDNGSGVDCAQVFASNISCSLVLCSFKLSIASVALHYYNWPTIAKQIGSDVLVLKFEIRGLFTNEISLSDSV